MSDVFNSLTKDFLTSVHTPDYAGKPEWVVIDKAYLNMRSLPKCEPKFWKIGKGVILEMTATEKNIVLSNEVKTIEPSIFDRISALEAKG
jgi:hypothetical protein